MSLLALEITAVQRRPFVSANIVGSCKIHTVDFYVAVGAANPPKAGRNSQSEA